MTKAVSLAISSITVIMELERCLTGQVIMKLHDFVSSFSAAQTFLHRNNYLQIAGLLKL